MRSTRYRSFLRPGTPLSEAPRARAAVVAAAREEGGGDIICPSPSTKKVLRASSFRRSSHTVNI